MNDRKQRVEIGKRRWKSAADVKKGVAETVRHLVNMAKRWSQTYRDRGSRYADGYWKGRRIEAMQAARRLLEETTEMEPVGRPLYTIFRPSGYVFERYPRHRVSISWRSDWRFVAKLKQYDANNPYGEELAREWAGGGAS